MACRWKYRANSPEQSPVASHARASYHRGPAVTSRGLEVRETPMTAVVITAGAAIFGLGFILGIIVLVSLGIRREERRFLASHWEAKGRLPITRPPTDPASVAARGVTGLWVRRSDAEKPVPAQRPAAGQPPPDTAAAAMPRGGLQPLAGPQDYAA